MTAKNALLFFLAVFGIIFIGAEACLPLIGLSSLTGALSTIGAIMLVVFFALVLGFGFIFKVLYVGAAVVTVTYAFNNLFIAGELVMGLVFAAVSFLLLALIPTIFLKK